MTPIDPIYYNRVMGSQELLTTKQVMKILNISKPQVYKLLKSGTISGVNIAKAGAKRPRYRFYLNELENLIAERSINYKKDK